MKQALTEMGKQVIKEGADLIRDPEEKISEVTVGERPAHIRKSTLTIIITLCLLVILVLIAISVLLISIFTENMNYAQAIRLLRAWGNFCVLFASWYVPTIAAVVFGSSLKYRNQKKDI